MKLLAALLFVFTGSAYADDMACQAMLAKNEPRPASLGVRCDGYLSQGYIANNQKVSSVTMEIFQGINRRQVVIANPSQEIRAYASPSGNIQVRKELKKYGITWSSEESVRLTDFTVDPAAKIYKDSGPLGGDLGNTPLMTKVETPAVNAVADCVWESTPLIVASPSCGNNNICYGRVNCSEKTAAVMCQPIGDKKMECPSADACGADPSFKFMDSAKPSNQLTGWNINGTGEHFLDSAGDQPTTNVPAN